MINVEGRTTNQTDERMDTNLHACVIHAKANYAKAGMTNRLASLLITFENSLDPDLPRQN